MIIRNEFDFMRNPYLEIERLAREDDGRDDEFSLSYDWVDPVDMARLNSVFRVLDRGRA